MQFICLILLADIPSLAFASEKIKTHVKITREAEAQVDQAGNVKLMIEEARSGNQQGEVTRINKHSPGTFSKREEGVKNANAPNAPLISSEVSSVPSKSHAKIRQEAETHLHHVDSVSKSGKQENQVTFANEDSLDIFSKMKENAKSAEAASAPWLRVEASSGASKPHAKTGRAVEVKVDLDQVSSTKLKMKEGSGGKQGVEIARTNVHSLSRVSEGAKVVKSVDASSEPVSSSGASSVSSVTAAGPWWFQYAPASILGVVMLSRFLYKSSQKEQRSNDVSGQKLPYLVPILTIVSALAAIFLMVWHVASPRTIICLFAISYIVFKEVHHRLVGDSGSQDIQYSGTVDTPGRLALLDNVKFMAMCGIIAHHCVSGFYVEESVNPFLRATALDRFYSWNRYFSLPPFFVCTGLMTKGRISRSNVAQLIVMWIILDLFWYWMTHSGSKEEPDLVAPFLYDSKQGSFFNPLRNYSTGGHLWWLQFMIIGPPLIFLIRNLAGESIAKMLILAHLTWLLLGIGLWRFMGTGIMDPYPNEKFVFMYTFMFPGFMMTFIGTLVTLEQIIKIQQHPLARPLGATVLVGYSLLWILSDKDSVASMVNQWGSPLYTAFVTYPQMVICNAAFFVCAPAGETFFTRAGARSLYVYILHPIVFGLIASLYEDFNEHSMPHPPGADYVVTLALIVGFVLLNLILGSGVVERAVKPILMG